MLMALMPALRTLRKSLSAVFFTTPERVAKTTKRSSRQMVVSSSDCASSRSTAEIFSSGCRLSKFLIERPFATRGISGSW